ncbi:unnamed protein product [Urochloa decumbens]|uniref:DUF1997 family protein n=1 Tax=Urochloa decumbens TaxID=240449 RepID=A0ABC9G127_9POAL
MAAVANTHGHQAWALAASSANRSSSRRPAAATSTRALLVRTGFAGAPNARAASGRPPPPPRRAVTTVRTRAGAAGVQPSSSSPDAVTYRASISTNTPLHEPPGPGVSSSCPAYLPPTCNPLRPWMWIGGRGKLRLLLRVVQASLDEYLQDRARVFRAMFPDESRSERLGDGEWRIQMLPLQFLLLTVRPVVVMELRHRAGGLDLRVTDWELRGLDRDHAPSSFDLGVSGSLYADRSRGHRAGCRMRGHLEIAITVVLPPPLRLVPESVLRGVTESVLSRLAEKMKRDVDVGLIADFQRFRREKAAAASTATPTLDEA